MVARQMSTIYHALVDELGGKDALTESERMTVRRLAALQMRYDSLMMEMSRGEDISDSILNSLHRSITKGMEDLGLSGPAKLNGQEATGPTVDEVLDEHDRKHGRSSLGRHRLIVKDDDDGGEGWSDDEDEDD